MALDPGLKDAVNYLKSHAHQMQAIIAVANAVTSVATLETLAGEAETRKVAAEAALADYDGQVKKASALLGDLAAKAEEARVEAKKLVDDAKAKAAGIIAKASSDGTARGETAEAEARARLGTIEASIETARQDLAIVNDEITAARSVLASTKADTADLVKRADEARAYLASLAKQG